MKNKGLHTLRRTIPLGDHKDQPSHQPAPPVSSAQAASTTTPEQPTKHTEQSSIDEQRRKKTRAQKPKVDKSPRLVLGLVIEQELKERLDHTIATIPTASQREYRRTLSKAFILYITEHGRKRVSYTPKNPVRQRVDLRLPKDIVAKLSTLDRLYPLETDSQVLSRYLSGHYAAFLEAELSKH